MYAWKMIRIYVDFRAAGKIRECLVPAGMMSSDVIKELYELEKNEMKDLWQPDSQTMIYEKNSGIFCDPHVSLSSMGAFDGMILEVY